MIKMETPIPWLQWGHQLCDHIGGATATATSIRAYLDDNRALLTPVEVFRGLWRHWCTASDHYNAHLAMLVLMVVILGKLEKKLTSALLQGNSVDTVDDICLLASAAEQLHVTHIDIDLQRASLGLLRVIGRLMESKSSASPAAEEEKKHLHQFLESNGADIQLLKQDRGECTTTVPSQESAMTWLEFDALPCGLHQSVLQRTKAGRAVAQEMEEIIAHQEWQLTARRRGEDLDDARVPHGKLWAAAELLMRAASSPELTLPQSVSIEFDSHEDFFQAYASDNDVIKYVSESNGQRKPVPQLLQDTTEHTSQDVRETKTLEAANASGSDDWCNEEAIDALPCELESLQQLPILCVRVAALIGRQLRTGVSFAERVHVNTRSKWERAIRKQVNSLTVNDDDASPHLLVLLRYAALDPSALLETALDSALTTTQHHDLFVRLLWLCPPLLRWPTRMQDTRTTHDAMVVVVLRQALSQLVSPQLSAVEPLARAPIISFLVALSGCGQPENGAKQVVLRECVLAPETVLRDIFWKLLGNELATTQTKTRLFSLMHYWLTHLVKVGRQLSNETLLLTALDLVVTHYTCEDKEKDDSAGAMDHQDITLVLSRELIILLHSTGSQDAVHPRVVKWIDQANVPLRSLLESFVKPPPAGNKENFPSSDISSVLTPETMKSIEHSLWCVVWTHGTQATATRDEHTGRIQTIASTSFVDATGASVSGASLIQVQVAQSMLSSGDRVYNLIHKVVHDVLISIVDPHVMSAARSASTGAETDRELSVMTYALRCWSLAAFGCHLAASSIVVLRLLERTLRHVDQAIEATATDPAGLLYCLHAAGVLFAYLRDKQRAVGKDAASTTRTSSSSVEMAATRVLFLLGQQPPQRIPTEDEPAFRDSVATVLVSTRLVECGAIKSFLKARGAS